MADDDNIASLKRDRSEDEEEERAAEENETSERPSKVSKKNDDVKEAVEEEKDAEDPPSSEGGAACLGSDGCGTDLNSDKGSDVDPPADENVENSSAVAKEETTESAEEQAGDTETKTATDEDAVPTTEETSKATEAAPTEDSKSTGELKTQGTQAPVEAETDTTNTADSGVSGLPPGVPSGLPNAPADPNVAATMTNPQSLVEERAELPRDLVGRVIGKGGEMIRDLQARSGCRVDVDQNVPDEAPRIITYRGTRQSVDFARQLVATLCSQDGRDADLPLGLATRKELIVPATSIGKVIGRGGEMIRDLQTRSQCKIQVDHSGTGVEPTTRLVVVTGTADAVVKAEEMILFLVANPTMDASTAIDMLVDDKARGGGVWGSGPPYPNLPNEGQGMQGPTGFGYAVGASAGPGVFSAPPAYQQPYGGGYGAAGVEMEIFHAAKNYMGRVIGQRGITINDLQKRSGCDIQINQDVPYGQDCEISIKGSRQGIDMAKTMLREIIEMGPNHPYAGGAPQAGGYPQTGYAQPPMQQAYGYQPVAQPAAYGGAFQPAYQPAPYGQPEVATYQTPQQYSYAMPQQPAYGGYIQQPHMQAPQPPAAPVAVWRTATTADGQTYYYNEKTGETQWEKPPGM